MSTQRVTRPWTKSEDSILREAVSQFSPSETIDWHRVASHLPRRNNKECRKRWVYSLESKICKGPWDEEEDRCLKNGVAKFGLKWAAVAEVVGSRQPDQCSRRWHEVVNPRISHERWSLLEDSVLKEAVDTYGRKWTEIVERFFPNRTPISARNRYKQRYESRNSSSTEERSDSISSDEQQKRANLLWTVPDHSQNGYESPAFTQTPSTGTSSSQWNTPSPITASSSPHLENLRISYGQMNQGMPDNAFAQQNRQVYPSTHRRNMSGSMDTSMAPMSNSLAGMGSRQPFGGADGLGLLTGADTKGSFSGAANAFASPMTTQMPMLNGSMATDVSPFQSSALPYGYNAGAPASGGMGMANNMAFQHAAAAAGYATGPMADLAGFSEADGRRLMGARAAMQAAPGAASSAGSAGSSRAPRRSAPRPQSMAF